MIPAGTRKFFSYTVKVNEGKTVSGKGVKVGGLEVNCPDVYIKNTLTKDETKIVEAAIDGFECDKGHAIDNVNAIYSEALGKNVFEETEYIQIRRGLLTVDSEGHYSARKAGGITKMIVPNMWGGRKYYTETYAVGRVSVMKPEYLVVGDIVLIDDGTKESFYIYSGKYLLNLESGERVKDTEVFLEGLLAVEGFFLLLRPSMMW